MQQQLEGLEAEGKDDLFLRDVQKILYSTEVSYTYFPPLRYAETYGQGQDGFEVPEQAVDEEETF